MPIFVQRVNYRKEVPPVKTQVYVAKAFDEVVRRAYYVPVYCRP